MSSSVKNKLQDLLQKVNSFQISLLELRKIFDGEFRSILEENRGNEELEELVEELTKTFAKKFGEFRKDWLENKIIEPTDEELDVLEYFNDKFSSFLISEMSDKEEEEEIREKAQKLKDIIQQERTRRKHQNQKSSNYSNVDIQALQQAIKNLQKQLSNLQTQQQVQPTIDNSSELKGIEQSLNQLQNNLQNIEQKKKMDNSSTSQQEKQELTKLKTELSKLQNQLKQNQTDKPQQQNTSQNKDSFNWLYIVIPLGVLTVILGIAIAYLLSKKNKKE